jgi:hypothetical protein
VLPFLAVLALSGWEAVQNRDSGGAHAGVVLVVAAAAVVALIAGVLRRRTSRAGGSHEEDPPAGDARGRAMVAGSAAWVVLLAAVVGWNAFSFSEQSANLPTLSSLLGHVTQFEVGRAVLFALWVAAGWLIATARPRR